MISKPDIHGYQRQGYILLANQIQEHFREEVVYTP